MRRSEVDREKLSPMMLQYMEIKDNYEDTIIFFRLGDFYEMFFDDAITVSKELELTLTGKDCGLEERAPMCGIPHHARDTYITKLVEDRDMLKKLQDNLYNTVKDKYTVAEVCKDRVQMYLDLFK